MPKDKPGATQINVIVPDEVLAAVIAKRGARSLNTVVCQLLAKFGGVPFAPPKRGRPPKRTDPPN